MRSDFFHQGKFYQGESIDAEPLREVLSSWAYIKDLAKLQEGANQKLRVKISEMATALEEDDYEICFEFITTSKLTDSAEYDLEVFRKELAESETLQATLNVIDNKTLKFRYDEALNKNRPYINHEFKLEDNKYVELSKLDDDESEYYKKAIKSYFYIIKEIF